MSFNRKKTCGASVSLWFPGQCQEDRSLKGKSAPSPSPLPPPRAPGQQNLSVWSGGWSGGPENQRLMGQILGGGVDFCSLTTRASDTHSITCGLKPQRKMHLHHTYSRIVRIFYQTFFMSSFSVFCFLCQYLVCIIHSVLLFCVSIVVYGVTYFMEKHMPL